MTKLQEMGRHFISLFELIDRDLALTKMDIRDFYAAAKEGDSTKAGQAMNAADARITVLREKLNHTISEIKPVL